MDKRDLPKVVLRITLSLIFIYFGLQQIMDVSAWAVFVPEIATKFFLSANNIVMLNAMLELVFGTLLLLGLYTRASALILSIHLFFIALSAGFVPLGVRDFGLTVATFVVYLNGIDEYCLDKKYKHKLA